MRAARFRDAAGKWMVVAPGNGMLIEIDTLCEDSVVALVVPGTSGPIAILGTFEEAAAELDAALRDEHSIFDEDTRDNT